MIRAAARAPIADQLRREADRPRRHRTKIYVFVAGLGYSRRLFVRASLRHWLTTGARASPEPSSPSAVFRNESSSTAPARSSSARSERPARRIHPALPRSAKTRASRSQRPAASRAHQRQDGIKRRPVRRTTRGWAFQGGAVSGRTLEAFEAFYYPRWCPMLDRCPVVLHILRTGDHSDAVHRSP